MRIKRVALVVSFICISLFWAGCQNATKQMQTDRKKQADYFQIVKSYAETLIEHGRDTYGKSSSPLIATTLDRKTLRIFEEEQLDKLWHMRLKDWENWRVRNRDRMMTGANPMHDQNLYQVLYALTEITGDKHYAQEADRTIEWFFRHCQSPSTGLMAWGEHMGWDFNNETLITWRKGKHHGGRMQEYNTHEFARPWVLWERSFELAPKACERFAAGLWDHQIADHDTGNFSRHANYEMHQTFINSEYPRHGGFYIATWAEAYRRTKDPLFAKAIETLVGYFDGRRNPRSGALPAESAPRSKGRVMWATSNLSLAIDLWESADKMPGELAKKMRQCASRTDEVFLKLGHKLRPGGKGFLITTHTDTLQPVERGAYTGPWGHAGTANLCLLRYRQVKLDGYKWLALATAALYLDSEPEVKVALHPGTLGQIIYLMLGVHELTGYKWYLNRADDYAQRAIELFITDDLPLPKSTSKHTHYEAVTGSDTLMMALLKLWATKNRPDLKLRFVYCDR
jgi:hypothetical protein